MFQQSPQYFKQYAKNFRYIVTDKYPQLPTDNFALAFHNTATNFCSVEGVKHWHMLLYSQSGGGGGGLKKATAAATARDGFAVPCPYSCFALLILGGVNIQFSGDIFDKLQRAVAYNKKTAVPSSQETNVEALKKRLPKVVKTARHHATVQTDYISNSFLDRVTQVASGPYGGQFNQIIDAFISGYGSVYTQHHSMVVNFELSPSQAQCYCFECTSEDYENVYN